MKVPLMLVGMKKSVNSSKRLRKLLEPLNNKSFKESIRQSRLKIKPAEYLGATLLNTIIYIIIFSALFTLLFQYQGREIIQSIISGIGIGLLLGTLMLLLLYQYPKIIAGKISELIDSELLFALNDMLVQVKAKIDLYKALVNVVESDYEYVGAEFLGVIDEVESGKSMIDALKNLALSTKSNFMKRTAWQLMNSLKSGSDSSIVIQSLINELETYYHALISSYTKELNVLTLIYLTLAVVAPTIGITVMIIISTFGGLSITRETITVIIALLIGVQPLLAGLINSRRPLVKV